LLTNDGRGPPTLFGARVLAHEPASGFAAPAALATLRAAAEASLRRYLPEPQASLAAGVLLGGSGQLDADFRLQLQRSGLAHLLAIDGSKQVAVAAALGALSVRLLGAQLATLPIVLSTPALALLSGAHLS